MNEITRLANELKIATPETKSALISQLVEAIAVELKPEAIAIVNTIEAKPETTKGHYGNYMQIVGKYTGIYRSAMFRALILAGANSDGIDGVKMILFGGCDV